MLIKCPHCNQKIDVDEAIRQSNRQKIIETLRQNTRLRWKELFQNTEMSTTTLSKRLKELVDSGIVEREVTPSFPPTVYYSLKEANLNKK